MKKYFVVMVALALLCGACAQKETPVLTTDLQFDTSAGVAGSITMPQGEVVNYTAYEHLYYVANVEDSTYQYLNVYVPEGATQGSPIFLRTYVGGYMASEAAAPQATDASGRALKEGYVVVIPGTRGRNSQITDKGGNAIYTGRAPKAILDLKAAVRYLRLFDKQMLGDAEKIVTDGTSAGGAMSSLLGGTGNHPLYDAYLKTMGAADTRDDVFAAVCYCPITDLDHADMAYEWLYNCTNNVTRPVTEAQQVVSDELAAMYPAYLNSLSLKKSDGTSLTADNYLEYVKSLLIKSAQIAKNAGADIPDTIGFKFNDSTFGRFMPPVNGGVRPQSDKISPKKMDSAMPMRRMTRQTGEYIVDLDMPTYLNYVVSTIALKTPPAFDSQGVAAGRASGENEEFGDETGNSVNFTDYSLRKATDNNEAKISAELQEKVRLLNPMYFIGDANTSVAPHWYIRHGARDRDTAFPIAINLATKLQNTGKDVNFLLAWNRPHSGDYALDELFEWLNKITGNK